MPSLQKKIRDLERLLKRKSGDEEGVSQIKQKIEQLKKENEDNKLNLKQKKNSRKYHMVRFFERRKCTRKIRSIDSAISLKRSQSEEDPENISISKEIYSLMSERERTEEDLTYILYYPKEWKYIALFVDDEDKSTRRTEARAIAIQRRAESVEAGEKDLVKHAIDVEYGLVQDIQQDELMEVDDDGSDQKKDIKVSAGNLLKEKRKRNSSDVIETNKITKVSESQTKKLTTKDSVQTITVLEKSIPSQKNTVILEPPEALDDPFFVEETCGDDGNIEVDSVQVLRGAVSRRGKGWKNSMRSSLNDTSGLSKQEMRLKQWQNKVRNKRVDY